MSENLRTLSIVNVSVMVMNVFGVPIEAGRSNIFVSSLEMSPVLVQQWSSSVLHATLCCFLLDGARIGWYEDSPFWKS